MLNRVTFAVLLFIASSAEIVSACTFCSLATGSTMLTDLDAADVAFIAELDAPTPVRSNPTAFDLLNQDHQKGEAGFIVRHVLRGKPEAGEGEPITVPLRVPGPSGVLHLLTHNTSEGRWQTYRLSDDGLKFVLGAASLPVLRSADTSMKLIAGRLEYCLRFLSTDDFMLRKAIFAELSQAPYSALRQLRPQLQRELLRDWMQAASKRAEEARQIFLLLSVGGDGSDVPMLKREFAQCLDSNWAGTLDGVILAYVALGGVEALDDVDQRLLSSRDRSVELKKSAAKALRFLVEHETDISRPRLLLSCRLLLNDSRTADLVVQDFARWENWPAAKRSRVD